MSEPGDQDVGGGAELGEQPVGERGLAGAVLALHRDVGGAGEVVAQGHGVLAASEDQQPVGAAHRHTRERERAVERVVAQQHDPHPAAGQRLDPQPVRAEGVSEPGGVLGDVLGFAAGQQLDRERDPGPGRGAPRTSGCGR